MHAPQPTANLIIKQTLPASSQFGPAPRLPLLLQDNFWARKEQCKHWHSFMEDKGMYFNATSDYMNKNSIVSTYISFEFWYT